MRRIVTGVNAAGRSYIVSNEAVDDSGFGQIWEVEPKQIRDWIRGIDPKIAATSIEPPPGSSRWMLATLPPEADDRERRRAHPIAGLDENGFHTTRTVDYDYVLQGPLTLILDEGSVELQTGDLVVQQATRHAWRNPGHRPAKLLAVVTTVP